MFPEPVLIYDVPFPPVNVIVVPETWQNVEPEVVTYCALEYVDVLANARVICNAIKQAATAVNLPILVKTFISESDQ